MHRSALNDSVHELDSLLESLDTERASNHKSYNKRIDQQNRFYNSTSSLSTSHKPLHYRSMQQVDSERNPLHQLSASAREVDQCAARMELELERATSDKPRRLPRGQFVKDVVEEEIFIDHVTPQYQPKAQRTDRKLTTSKTNSKMHKSKVSFRPSDDNYDDETYDNTDNTYAGQHINKNSASMNSLNSLDTDNSQLSENEDQQSMISANSLVLDSSAIVNCFVCNERVVGQVITALGRSYHKHHFTCAHCNQELGTKNFYERDNLPYCEHDYQALFSPKCAYCLGPILDKVTIALDKTFHPEHFVCAHCGCQFETEDGFHEKDGKPYCKNDFFELFANKCGGCNLPITANYITALDCQWHPDCFVCSDCHCPFADGKFFDIDNAPYCEIHYHARRGSLCAACKLPVIGKCTTAMFRKFHTDHFTCTYCLKVLSKTFKEESDKPYCHDCFDKLFS